MRYPFSCDSRPWAWLPLSLRIFVVALAIAHFAENTADPDLWGHVLFGQRILHLGGVEKTEPFSWTAHGAAWINHETLAEAALGLTHRLGGATGLLLLKMAVGLLTFALALRLGARRLDGGGRTLAWAVAGLAVVEIGFGFAARPQIFTALGLAIELWLIARVAAGRLRWAWAFPVLFLVWFNTHGGAVLGLLLLLLAGGALLVEWAWSRRRPDAAPGAARAGIVLALAAAASGLTAFATPWGVSAPLWLVKSVSWSRPVIEEWNPPAPGWDHASFFGLAALTVLAAFMAPRGARLWQWVTLAVLGAAAARYVRHAPLFAIAAVALLPPALSRALTRFDRDTARLTRLLASRGVRAIAAAALIAAAAGVLYVAFFVRHERPLAMEIPRSDYPVAAIDFMKTNRLDGNLLVWFDWGELCLWELPDCPVSIDGRLDTCYPMPLIDAHWRFYAGQTDPGPALDLRRADLALLPAGLKGWLALSPSGGWYPVYRDPVAELRVRDPGRFPALRGRRFPVEGPAAGTVGREPFPDRPSARAAAVTRTEPRPQR